MIPGAMGEFEVLEHTADIGFRARARSREELFETAALALCSVAMETESAEPRVEYPLAASGADDESLLVNWLSEVLYWIDGRRIAFSGFEVRHSDAEGVSGVGRGEPLNPLKHPTRTIVKAVTYHQLRVARDERGWVAEVFLDV